MNTLVSFELAKLLKEKGFDNESAHYYNEKGEMLFDVDYPSLQPTKPDVYYDNPTIAEVVMWLYEKHGIWIVINPHKGENDLGKPFMEFDPEVWTFTNECVWHNTGLLYFNSPTEAYEAAIKYCLTKLI